MDDYAISHDDVAAAFPEFDLSGGPLAPGGMKNAYRGTSSGGDELVLKLVRQPLEPDEEGRPTIPERVHREIVSMSRVAHPRVVRILDGPEVREVAGQQRLWYTEPYIAGGDLTQHLDDPWPQDRVLDLGRGLLEGVGVLWDAGIVHRDIKPANVALDDQGGPVLLDLGIALVTDLAALTESGLPSPRTNRYAAPEQFEARRRVQLDFRTDLFAVGLVMYEVLTGSHAFQADRPDNYLDRLFVGRWDRETARKCGASDEFVAVLDRFLAPRLNQRFRLISQAYESLEAVK